MGDDVDCGPCAGACLLLWSTALAVRFEAEPSADLAGLKPCATSAGVLASHHAPAAAATFNPTPTHVVARRPSAGIRRNPAPMAPSAAPAVFAAYSSPASA